MNIRAQWTLEQKTLQSPIMRTHITLIHCAAQRRSSGHKASAHFGYLDRRVPSGMCTHYWYPATITNQYTTADNTTQNATKYSTGCVPSSSSRGLAYKVQTKQQPGDSNGKTGTSSKETLMKAARIEQQQPGEQH